MPLSPVRESLRPSAHSEGRVSASANQERAVDCLEDGSRNHGGLVQARNQASQTSVGIDGAPAISAAALAHSSTLPDQMAQIDPPRRPAVPAQQRFPLAGQRREGPFPSTGRGLGSRQSHSPDQGEPNRGFRSTPGSNRWSLTVALHLVLNPLRGVDVERLPCWGWSLCTRRGVTSV